MSRDVRITPVALRDRPLKRAIAHVHSEWLAFREVQLSTQSQKGDP